MNPPDEFTSALARISRRRALKTIGGGLGSMALGNLLAGETSPGPAPHHATRARRVIYLFQSGGPSQVDLFDHSRNQLDNILNDHVFETGLLVIFC